MSLNIDTALVKGFETGVMHVAQQMGSVLRDTVMVDRVSRGEEFAWDVLGVSDPQEITTRHAKTPMGNIDHTKRWATPHVFAAAEGIDKADALRTINDFTNPYTEAIGMGFGREFDRQIIAAANGSAKTGKTGSGSVALPAAQKILHQTAGLTKEKINDAAKRLRAAHVMKPWFMVVTADQVEDMMNDQEITSADYNSVRLLMQGEIDTFGGFKWRVSQELTDDGTSRLCLAYGKRYMKLAVQKEPEARISERDDLNYTTQVWFQAMVGAVRMQDVGVVQIACNE